MMFFRRYRHRDGGKGVIDDSFRSPNYDERAGRVSALVFHYTGMRSKRAALERLCDGTLDNRVSSHYVVSEGGDIYRLVEERYRAWHAGVSCWRGYRDLNDRSIGIEVVNPGHEFGYRRFPRKQMEAVRNLSRDIIERHGISAPWILGHSDIAVGRKKDPGELFDWRYLAEGGVGFFPAACCAGEVKAEFGSDDVGVRPGVRLGVRLGVLLGMMGYDCGGDMGECIVSFRRRWGGVCVEGLADGDCVLLAERVLRGWGEL